MLNKLSNKHKRKNEYTNKKRQKKYSKKIKNKIIIIKKKIHRRNLLLRINNIYIYVQYVCHILLLG